MGLLDLYKKKKALTFDEIDSRDKAEKKRGCRTKVSAMASFYAKRKTRLRKAWLIV